MQKSTAAARNKIFFIRLPVLERFETNTSKIVRIQISVRENDGRHAAPSDAEIPPANKRASRHQTGTPPHGTG